MVRTVARRHLGLETVEAVKALLLCVAGTVLATLEMRGRHLLRAQARGPTRQGLTCRQGRRRGETLGVDWGAGRKGRTPWSVTPPLSARPPQSGAATPSPAGRDRAPSTERWWAGGISVLGSGSKTAYVNSCLDKTGLTAPLPTQVQLHFPACALKQLPQLHYTRTRYSPYTCQEQRHEGHAHGSGCHPESAALPGCGGGDPADCL